jgi:type I restriction enzyme M protein
MSSHDIAETVQMYGEFKETDTSQIIDNRSLGYTRVTIERPLRLRYQMTLVDKARFLDACPHLLDDVQAIDKVLGRAPQGDWNVVWRRVADLLRARKSQWKTSEQKLFRTVFTLKDPEAAPVGKNTQEDAYEADPDLRDSENVPLDEDVDAYFEREVRPHLPDAWMDRTKDRVGYEINFNRFFYKHTMPRPLDQINAELKSAEEDILKLLQQVTE